jgi:protein phosphatase
VAAPGARRAVFLGDLADRGPRARRAAHRDGDGGVGNGARRARQPRREARQGVARPRRARGRGLEQSLADLDVAPPAERTAIAEFVGSLPSHVVLDHGRLVVAHAGMRADLQGRDSKRVTSFALYGETTGEVDALGLPVRLDWARSYRGRAMVVYGHTPVVAPEWRNRTINVDTGCVFGGA